MAAELAFDLPPLYQETRSTTAAVLTNGGYAKLIEMRIEFLSIGEVDTMNERYHAEIIIKSRWYDDEEITVFNKELHWHPKLYIENALQNNKEEISYHVSRFKEKTIVTEVRIAKGLFWERIELQNFPIDVQELSVTIASKLKPNQVKLVSDSEKISSINHEALNTFRDQQKWKLYSMVKISEWASYDIGSEISLLKDNKLFSEFHQIKFSKHTRRPKLVATIYASRRPGYYLLNCYSFIFLITILSLTLFAIDTRFAQNRISGTFTLILTSVSFKSNTNRAIPTISYMTSLDKYQIISIIYLCVCCVWHSIISSSNFEMTSKLLIDKILLYTLAAIFLSIQVIFAIGILVAYKKIKELEKMEACFIDRISEDSSDDESVSSGY